MTEKKCTACGAELRFMKREQLQLGRNSLLTGAWSNYFAGAQDVELWACPHCYKLEFYIPEDQMDYELDGRDGIAQIVCPVCGAQHDMDDPKCPRCGCGQDRLSAYPHITKRKKR